MLGILAAEIRIPGRHMSGEVMLWPKPRAMGERPTAPTMRAARLVLFQPCLQTERQQGLPIACSTVPGWLMAWPRLLRDSELPPAGSRSRRELLLDMAKALISCPKGQWWWPKEEGALGQAYQAGRIPTVQGQRFVDAMPSKARAHFCSVTYWQRGVFLASILHCRETVATEIKNLWLPEVSTELGQRLYQHARDPPKHALPVDDHHGWQGAPQRRSTWAQ